MSRRHKTRNVRQRQALRYVRSYLDRPIDLITLGWAADARLGGDVTRVYRDQMKRCVWCRTHNHHLPANCPTKRRTVDRLRVTQPAFAEWLVNGDPSSTPPPWEYRELPTYTADYLSGGMSGSGKAGAMRAAVTQALADGSTIFVVDEMQQITAALPPVDIDQLARDARKPGIADLNEPLTGISLPPLRMPTWEKPSEQ